jgi:hypothetical protein
MEDMNTREYLERVKGIVLENVRKVGGPPSVQLTGEWRQEHSATVVRRLLAVQIFHAPPMIMRMTTRTKIWTTRMNDCQVSMYMISYLWIFTDEVTSEAEAKDDPARYGALGF